MLRAFGLYTHIRSNIVKSMLLLAGFPFVLPVVFFCLVFVSLTVFGHRDAFAVAGSGAIMLFIIVLAITVVWLPIAYFFNQWVVDQATGARPLTRTEDRRTWNLLENLCISRGMTMPALRLIETEALNAFASGMREGDYSVTVTRGLVETLTDSELQAVLGHELTHIRNRDVQVLVVGTILVGIVPIVHSFAVRAFWVLIMFVLKTYRGAFTLLPMPGAKALVTVTYNLLFLAAKAVTYVIGSIGYFCSLLVNFALSRRREFLADAGAVELTKDPDAMISALRKIEGRSDIPVAIEGIREMFFDNPRIAGIEGLLATHPPIEKRIDALIRYGRDVAKLAAEISLIGLKIGGETDREPPRKKTADYYPSLELAIKGHSKGTTFEGRREIYDAARQALIKQLRMTRPPVREADIQQEQIALEQAIHNIEVRTRRNSSERRTSGAL